MNWEEIKKLEKNEIFELTDEEMLKLNLNINFTSIYQVQTFEKELAKRGLVENEKNTRKKYI